LSAQKDHISAYVRLMWLLRIVLLRIVRYNICCVVGPLKIMRKGRCLTLSIAVAAGIGLVIFAIIAIPILIAVVGRAAGSLLLTQNLPCGRIMARWEARRILVVRACTRLGWRETG
jgi:hypothetical protein